MPKEIRPFQRRAGTNQTKRSVGTSPGRRGPTQSQEAKGDRRWSLGSIVFRVCSSAWSLIDKRMVTTAPIELKPALPLHSHTVASTAANFTKKHMTVRSTTEVLPLSTHASPHPHGVNHHTRGSIHIGPAHHTAGKKHQRSSTAQQGHTSPQLRHISRVLSTIPMQNEVTLALHRILQAAAAGH